MIAYQLTGESDRDHAKREFNVCMRAVGHCNFLQTLRYNTRHYSAAKFYQFEAARWYQEALECRARYNTIVAKLIPGTDLRWDEIFYMQTIGNVQGTIWDEIFYMQTIGRVRAEDEAMQRRAHKIVADPRWRGKVERIEITQSRQQEINETGIDPVHMSTRATPRGNTLTIAQQALKLAASSAYGGMKSPAQKYNNPRDVPIKIEEISEQLKRWLE